MAVVDWVSWRRVAVAGLVALLAAMLLGSWLPDPAQLDPAELAELQVTSPRVLAIARRLPAGRLLTSPWLMSVPAVLAVAIGFNLADRVSRRRRAGAAPPLRFRPQRTWTSARSPAEVARAMEPRLAGRYRLEAADDVDGARLLVARAGAVGFWGSITFHVALIVALVAVTLTFLGASRAHVQLVEGEHQALDAPDALRVARAGPLTAATPHVLLQLQRAEARYKDDRFPVDYRAELVTVDGRGALRQQTVRVNGPVEVDGVRLLLKYFDMAPILQVDRGGERVIDGPVSLLIRRGDEDNVLVPGAPDRLLVRWFGDVVREGTKTSSRSELPRNPALGLRWQHQGKIMPETALVRLGETVHLGPYTVSFPESRYWIELAVERDPGAAVLLVALVLASVGLAVRFWDHDRDIRVRIAADGAGSRISAAARSRYFPALIARELDDLEKAST